MKINSKIVHIVIVSAVIASSCTGSKDNDSFNKESKRQIQIVSPTTPTPVIYPSREEVINYVADMKKVSPNEIEIINFNIVGRDPIRPSIPYQDLGYVTVSMIIANYTTLLIYKNSSNVDIVADYTASSKEEKELYEVLTNISLVGAQLNGRVIPTNITITNRSNQSFTLNKSINYRINYGLDRNFSVIENSYYATFGFVADYYVYHQFWSGSKGWIFPQTKEIWIRMLPTI